MTVSHGFAHGHNVRFDVVLLECPPVLPDPSKADLDFVRYTNSSGGSHVLVNFLEIILGGNHLTPAADQALCDEGANAFSTLGLKLVTYFLNFVGIEGTYLALFVLGIPILAPIYVGQ